MPKLPDSRRRLLGCGSQAEIGAVLQLRLITIAVRAVGGSGDTPSQQHLSLASIGNSPPGMYAFVDPFFFGAYLFLHVLYRGLGAELWLYGSYCSSSDFLGT